MYEVRRIIVNETPQQELKGAMTKQRSEALQGFADLGCYWRQGDESASCAIMHILHGGLSSTRQPFMLAIRLPHTCDL